jgi:hypothetical protein
LMAKNINAYRALWRGLAGDRRPHQRSANAARSNRQQMPAAASWLHAEHNPKLGTAAIT